MDNEEKTQLLAKLLSTERGHELLAHEVRKAVARNGGSKTPDDEDSRLAAVAAYQTYTGTDTVPDFLAPETVTAPAKG